MINGTSFDLVAKNEFFIHLPSRYTIISDLYAGHACVLIAYERENMIMLRIGWLAAKKEMRTQITNCALMHMREANILRKIII